MSKPRTILGFDYGTKKIGIAIGQELTGTATPVTTLAAINQHPNWDKIEALISEWKPDILVVGLPLNMDGSEHQISKAARKFANQLHGRFRLPISLIDERLTTIEAKQQLSNVKKSSKNPLDAIAARLIVESWLAEQAIHGNKH